MKAKLIACILFVGLASPASAASSTSSPLSQVPSDAVAGLPHLSKVDVYDSSNAKVGLIGEVLVGPDGKVVAYVLNVDVPALARAPNFLDAGPTNSD